MRQQQMVYFQMENQAKYLAKPSRIPDLASTIKLISYKGHKHKDLYNQIGFETAKNPLRIALSAVNFILNKKNKNFSIYLKYLFLS